MIFSVFLFSSRSRKCNFKKIKLTKLPFKLSTYFFLANQIVFNQFLPITAGRNCWAMFSSAVTDHGHPCWPCTCGVVQLLDPLLILVLVLILQWHLALPKWWVLLLVLSWYPQTCPTLVLTFSWCQSCYQQYWFLPYWSCSGTCYVNSLVSCIWTIRVFFSDPWISISCNPQLRTPFIYRWTFMWTRLSGAGSGNSASWMPTTPTRFALRQLQCISLSPEMSRSNRILLPKFDKQWSWCLCRWYWNWYQQKVSRIYPKQAKK